MPPSLTNKPSPLATAVVPLAVPPSIKLISAAVAVTPSKIFNSAAVAVTAVPAYANLPAEETLKVALSSILATYVPSYC